MSFYLNPPGGNISLQKLETFAVSRMQFLLQVYQAGADHVKLMDVAMATDNVASSDCLIAGSVKDRISHFLLRLSCSGDDAMTKFFIAMETRLFDFRMSCMTSEEICKLFRSLKSHLCCLNMKSIPVVFDTADAIIAVFLTMKGELSWRKISELYLSGENRRHLTVPFQTVLPLISSRTVVLHRGLAQVPLCKLKDVVTSLFQQLLVIGMRKGRQLHKHVTADPRVARLFLQLKYIFRQKFRSSLPREPAQLNLSHDRVDEAVIAFPPCMSNLVRVLREKHRLRHQSRIQLTLFLKEAGLPVHEALMFWRKEYSQEASEKDGCRHSWQEHEGRYTYSIRHLYGLEGSRINYHGHSCIALQESTYGPMANAGCPFTHFDSKHLVELMKTEGVCVYQEEVLQLVEAKQFSEACAMYRVAKYMGHKRDRDGGTVQTQDQGVHVPGRDGTGTCKCGRAEFACNSCECEEGSRGFSALQYCSVPDRSVQENSTVTSKRCQPENDGSKCKRTERKKYAQIESDNDVQCCCVGNSQLPCRVKLLGKESTNESRSVADIRNNAHVHCECNTLLSVSPDKVKTVKDCRTFSSPPNKQQGSKGISCGSDSLQCCHNSEDVTISQTKWTKRKRKLLEHVRPEQCYQMCQERNSCYMYEERTECNCKFNVPRHVDSIFSCGPNLAASRQSKTCLKLKTLGQPDSVPLEPRTPEEHCNQSPTCTDNVATLLSSHEVKTPVDCYLSYRQMQAGLKSWQ